MRKAAVIAIAIGIGLLAACILAGTSTEKPQYISIGY